MSKLQDWMTRKLIEHRDEEGQGLAEYGLILALVGIAALGALAAISGGINDVLNAVGSTLSGA
jgi:pilus assembly protein Flp/PilA